MSELSSTILLLLIAVILSVIILTTLNSQLAKIERVLSHSSPCLLSARAYGNWSGSTLQSLVIFIQNLGDAPCSISSVYLVGEDFTKPLAGYPKPLNLIVVPYSYTALKFKNLNVNCEGGCRVKVTTSVGSYVEVSVE